MKRIPLTQGQFAIVDDEDYPMLMEYKWHALRIRGVFYARRGVNRNLPKDGAFHSMHRMIMGVTNPRVFVDHIDRNPLNNQKSNLRICNNTQNCQNQKGPERLLPKGVCANASGFIAMITSNKKRHYLGTFRTPKAAGLAYNEAAKKLHGEFAYLNSFDS